MTGPESFARVHGPTTFSFAYGHTRFVALHAQPGVTGEVEVRGADSPEGLAGPREDDLAFLDRTLGAAEEPHRVVSCTCRRTWTAASPRTWSGASGSARRSSSRSCAPAA